MMQCGAESHGYVSWGSGARLERLAGVPIRNVGCWDCPEPCETGGRDELLDHVTHELTTTAGLTLTDAQVSRLLGFDRELCGRVIEELSARGILRHTHESTYEVVRSHAA